MPLPPGPRLPALVQTLDYLTRPAEFLRKCHDRYGDVFTIATVIFGREVVVVRPETIKKVFTGDPDKLRAGEGNSALAPVLGPRSVLLLDGEEHLRQRRLMMPPFHGERMRAYAQIMQSITERTMARWPNDRPFRLHPEMQRITLDVILRTIFGVDEGKGSKELGDALANLLDELSNPIATIATMPALRHRAWGLSPWAAFERRMKRVDDLVYAQIRRRREAQTKGDDVLSMLLEAKDEDGVAMTDGELRDELITLLGAGHETTATALCWAFESILRTPRVFQRIQEELAASDGSPEAKLPYLEATIKEVLRLHPVVPAVSRRVKEPMTIDGFDVPEGVLLVPAAFLTHRLPDIYPNPESFEPERFLDTKTDPYAWLPFGGGIRRCLGMAFAVYEMKIVLSTILSRLKLRVVKPKKAKILVRGFTHSPRGGVPVIVERRLPARVAASRDTPLEAQAP